MRIGELSRRTGASVRAIRYYEQAGLLAARRAPGGYRLFEEEDVELVSRVRVLLRNGLTVEEIRPVAVRMDTANERSVCDRVIELYHTRLADLETRIRELQEVRDRVGERVAFLERQRLERRPNP